MNKLLTRVALIVNPWAGIGGALAMKGSDGEQLRQQVIIEGLQLNAPERIKRFLECLLPYKDQLLFVTFPSYMGEKYFEGKGFSCEVLCQDWLQTWSYEGQTNIPLSSSTDTQQAARISASAGVDLLVFSGGDGTARDISIGLANHTGQVCLGIPSGVKIQSAVYGRNPESSAASLITFLNTAGVSIVPREVRDIDEEALRNGKVGSRYFSDLLVPVQENLSLTLQASKQGSSQAAQSLIESEQLLHEEIAAFLIEKFGELSGPEPLLIVGAGHTTRAFKRQLGNEASLLGIDVFLGNELIQKDVTESQLHGLLDEYSDLHPTYIIVSVIGGQGCILGRGTQPISPKVITRVLNRWGEDALLVLATESKLAALPNRNLFVDTGDQALDQRLGGSRQVIVNFDARMLCKVLC